MPQVRRFALVAAPLIGGGVALALPGSFVDADGATQPIVFAARIVAALVVWMALWWMLEPIPIYATALLPLVVIPMTGVAPLSEVVSHYTSTLLVLFLGGFILALALQRWGLHQRIATLALHHIGGTPRRILGALMAVAAFLSLWMSNTSTTLMMVPIVLVMVPLTWALLAWVLFPFEDSSDSHHFLDLRDELMPVTPMRFGEWAVLLICAATALMWMIRLPL